MALTRRHFLGAIGSAGIVSLSGPPPSLFARAAANSGNDAERILVVVQLAGGNDGLNTVIPFGDDEYRKARPSIGVDPSRVIKLADGIGLHPSLAAFGELYEAGEVAVVQGVGYENPDRSHFRSMDIWHSARSDMEYTRDGWLGRALDESARSTPIGAMAIGVEQLPLAMRSTQVTVPTIRDLDRYRLEKSPGGREARESKRTLFETATQSPHAETSNLEFLRRTLRTAVTSAERLKSIRETYTSKAKYPATRLASQMQLVAQLIASESDTRIYFVSLDGFDTHADQVGAHDNLLTQLSEAVGAFFGDLKDHKLHERVTVATYSEFGRRVKENGSLGTDHGAASQMFVIGSNVRAGLIGEHPSLTDLHQGDLTFHTDFRTVYASLLEHWLKVDSRPVLGHDASKLSVFS